jgi:3-isopropylmalate/(R)-2-methylmalate dehydratase large subunit
VKNPLIHTALDGSRFVSLTEGKRVLFLTKDPALIRSQLAGEVELRMEDVDPADLLDDINTDVMTPAWVCFRYQPADIAVDAYAGLVDAEGERVFVSRALLDGGFEVIVSGQRKGTGSSRETAPQCEKWSGVHLVIASSFAPIHERNNINLGQLMADYAMLERLQAGEEISLEEFTASYDDIRRSIVEDGGLFAFDQRVASGERVIPTPEMEARPMTMAEKLLASHLVGGRPESCVRPGDDVLVKVDGGYSHEFTTAQVHHFLAETYGPDYAIQTPHKFAVFEDHLLYADGVPQMAPFGDQIETLRRLQREFQEHTGCRDYSAKEGISPGICHQVAREQFIDCGDFIQATDSHTCMGGASNALAWGVGATQYAALVYSGFTGVRVPESIRFELVGALAEGVTAKDVMLQILRTHAVAEDTLDRVMEFGGPGLTSLSMDERATLTNMATECSARTGICEGDEALAAWLAARREGASALEIASGFVTPDEGAEYAGGVHTIDLSTITSMVARPGDPTYGEEIEDLEEVKIDIAYGGSCTAGKETDLDFYAQVFREADEAGLKVADGVHMYIQFGSETVRDYATERGYLATFERAGVEVIQPGCGACIGCGPGVSEGSDEVTVSAINRNFQGRSGPGQLYLASPLTVAASAVVGHITAFTPGMFMSRGAEVTTPS